MKNLAIFYGGKSVEHDISIITALQVMNNIDTTKYTILPIYIAKDGKWIYIKDYKNMNNYTGESINKNDIVGIIDSYIIKQSKFGLKRLKKIDVAINCMHGTNGEDGSLSGVLEMYNIPYVGSSVLASSVGMDKVIQKDVFRANNIPVAKYYYFYKEDYYENKDKIINEVEDKIGYPAVVKPANLGSSIGINFSKNREELQKNIEIALNFDKKVIIEEQILNLREINCSVIGNYKIQETSVLEEPKNWKTFLDFDEKYLSAGDDKKQIDVNISPEIDNKIKNTSLKIFKLLGCNGVIRIDFLFNTETEKIYVNEINTIPGSLANYLWQHKYKFGEFLDMLIEFALEEKTYKNMHKYTYASCVLEGFSVANNKIQKVK